MMGTDRRRTVGWELTVDDQDLRAKLQRDERLVAKSASSMRRELNRVESGVDRMGGGAVARGARTARLGGGMAVGGRARDMLRGAATMGGVYGIGQEIKKAKQFEEVLVDVAVRGGKTRDWMDRLRGSMIDVSNEFGIGKEQLADYVGTIIDQTGNTELATKTLRDMAAVAYSANVPMKALAGTVVEMQSKLALAPDEFIAAMGVLASQADKGKVPLKDMSQYLPEVLNAAGAFGHKGIQALREYGAVLQMSARGAGSLAEANTAMNRGLEQIIAKREKIEKVLGIALKKDGEWLGLADMLKLIAGRLAEVQQAGGKLMIPGRGKRGKATAVDVEKFTLDIFGIRGKKMMLPMIQQAMAGWTGKVGATAGGEGGLTSFQDLIATGGAKTIGERVARKRELSPELDAWNKGVERLKNKLHMHLLPALSKLGEIIPAISSALGWMIDNWKLLLTIWASSKMLSFFNTLTMAGGGLRGMIGAGARMIGLGGATTAATTAAAGGGGGLASAGLSGLASLAPAVSTASLALGGFALALAPAAAGLKELADAYDPKKQKELRDRLTRDQRGSDFIQTFIDQAFGKRDETGKLRRFEYLDDARKRTFAEKYAAETRQRYGVTAKGVEKLKGAYARILGGEYEEGAYGIARFGAGKAEKLAAASDYELKQLGLTKEMATQIAAFARATPQALDSLAKGWTDLATFLKQYQPQIVDPNKTAAGVTARRQTVKK